MRCWRGIGEGRWRNISMNTCEGEHEGKHMNEGWTNMIRRDYEWGIVTWECPYLKPVAMSLSWMYPYLTTDCSYLHSIFCAWLSLCLCPECNPLLRLTGHTFTVLLHDCLALETVIAYLDLVPALCILSSDEFYDGGGERQTHQDIQHRHHEVRTFCGACHEGV